MKYCVFILIVLFAACKDEYNYCTEPKDVRFVAKIYQRAAGADVLTAAPNFSLFEIKTGINFYTNQPAVNTFSMPFATGLDTTKLVVTISNSLPKDTVTIIYTTQEGSSISADCGRLFFYTITNVLTTTNTLDSIKIINPILNTSLSQNAKVYF